MNKLRAANHEDGLLLLRQATQQTSRSVLLLQRRAQLELQRTKDELESQAARLATSASLLQATLESTRDGVVGVNLVGAIVLFNSRFAAMWSVPSGLLESGDDPAVVGHMVEQVREPERLIAAVRRSREEPNYEDMQMFQLVDGRWLERFSAPQLLGGKCVGVVIHWRDVTERLRASQAIQEREVAERANRAKSEFLTRVSHELRTPLNAVIGFSEILQLDPNESLTPLQRHRVEHIRSAGGNLLSLIDDVLDLSRLESGSVALQIRDVDVAEMAQELVEQISPLTGGSSVTLSVHIAPGFACIARADPDRLRQVLHNLLSNAVKYNVEGGSVSVHVGHHGGRLNLAVSDTGMGLSSDQLKMLFQPFNRLGREQSKVRGTGIGLVIARDLVALMGATLSVKSQLGVGSEFTVQLIASANVAIAEAPTASATVSAPVQKQVHGRVLYVDDNEVNRMLLSAFVEMRPNVELTLASDGQSALSAARTSPPDLILLDILMPGLSGYDVLRALRADPVLRRVPCLAVSASAMPDEVAIAVASGFDGYLTKPLTVVALLSELDRRLSKACS